MRSRSLITLAALAFAAATAGAQGNVVHVVASDYTFDAPDSIPAGMTTFEFTNTGPELHHMQLVRLLHGKTMQDFAEAAKTPEQIPDWLEFLGGPNAPIPNGQATSTVSVDLEPGTYVMICSIPSPDGTPHMAKGMVRPIEVTAPAKVAQAGAPATDDVLTLYDYNFTLDKPLTAGTHRIRVRNTASQWHEAFIAMLPPGTPVTAFPEWIANGQKGPPPVMPVGGVVAIGPGDENILTVTLAPGEYGFYCFLPDAKDGKEHVQHGMFKQFSVK